MLRTERTKTAALTNSLREETARLTSERERAACLESELTRSKAQALGSYLLLASLRKRCETIAAVTVTLSPSPLASAWPWP